MVILLELIVIFWLIILKRLRFQNAYGMVNQKKKKNGSSSINNNNEKNACFSLPSKEINFLRIFLNFFFLFWFPSNHFSSSFVNVIDRFVRLLFFLFFFFGYVDHKLLTSQQQPILVCGKAICQKKPKKTKRYITHLLAYILFDPKAKDDDEVS